MMEYGSAVYSSMRVHVQDRELVGKPVGGPPFPGSLIPAEVQGLQAPRHGISGIICQGSNHIPRLASIGSGSAPCRIPVFSGRAVWVQDSMAVEPALWQLVYSSSRPHDTALDAWEPGQKVILILRTPDTTASSTRRRCHDVNALNVLYRPMSLSPQKPVFPQACSGTKRYFETAGITEMSAISLLLCYSTPRAVGRRSSLSASDMAVCSLRYFRGPHGMALQGLRNGCRGLALKAHWKG